MCFDTALTGVSSCIMPSPNPRHVRLWQMTMTARSQLPEGRDAERLAALLADLASAARHGARLDAVQKGRIGTPGTGGSGSARPASSHKVGGRNGFCGSG